MLLITEQLMKQLLKRQAIIMVLCIGSGLLAVAQPTIQASVSKNQVLIGEQFNLTIKATLPKADFFIRWVQVPDSLEHFEVVSSSKIDSTFSSQKLTALSQTITFTSFDSGKFTLPPLSANFTSASNDTTYNLFTDSFPVTVAYLADSTNTLKDIKTIREVKDEIPLWYWFAGAAALLVLILLGIWLYRRYKKTAPADRSANRLSAYQQAMLDLETLKEMNVSTPAGIKAFHSRLPEILKQYLSSAGGTRLGSSTTSELLISLHQLQIDRTTLSGAAAALRCSDAVKFAKYLPATEESGQCLLQVKQLIEQAEAMSNTNKNNPA